MIYGDSLSGNITEIGFLEQCDEVSLSSLLERGGDGALESEIGLNDFSNLIMSKTLEWKLHDEELSALLVLADVLECTVPGSPVPNSEQPSSPITSSGPSLLTDFRAVCFVLTIEVVVCGNL